jgi:hypothetical protein
MAVYLSRLGTRQGCLALFLGLAWPATAAAEVAVLQGLDKITARISTFEAPAGEVVHFGSLEIVAQSCQKTPPEEPPETAAFLEIVDVRPDSESVALFSGWMYATTPAVSAQEHPDNEVREVDCKPDAAPAEASESDTDG